MRLQKSVRRDMMHPILFLLVLGSTASPIPAALAVQAGHVSSAVAGATAEAIRSVPAPAPVIASLRSDLERLIQGPAWRGDKWSVMVVSLDRGDTLFAHEPDATLAPASNMKLFTSAAALYYLGSEFRYSTYLLTDAPIVQGVLQGDLILYGTGDPTLSDRFLGSKTAVWEAFADSLGALAITEIRGDVVGDASYFDGKGTGDGWQDDYMNAWYAAPASALTFNENIVTLLIKPGAKPGWRPELTLVPGGEGIAIVNQATTVGGGRTWIDVNRAAYDGPIVVRGRISTGSPGIWRAVPVADPARFAAAVLREVLQNRGIRVLGGIRSITSPAESPLTGRSVFAPAFEKKPPLRVLAIHQSPPLVDILEVVNKKSHNLYAESVLRTVGRVALGDGSVEGGQRAVHYLLKCETGLDSLALRMYDGSGLSVLNRVSARTVVDLLTYMAGSPMWDSYWETLPEAGDARGLRRMYGTGAERNLRAKTGTIDHVSALSGYVRSSNGERLAFSIISNNVPSTWRAKRVEDAFGARLAAFHRPTGVVAPPPGAPPARAVVDEGEAPQPEGATDPGPPASEGRTHVIRKGDTLDGIAKRYGTTVKALEKMNPGVTPRRLMPGRKLKIP